MTEQYEALLRIAEGIPYTRDVQMRHYTTLRIGGPADLLLRPDTEEDLLRAAAACHALELPVYLLGNGSNILVRDEGIRGVVLQLGNGFAALHQEGLAFTAGAGMTLAALARETLARGCMGLEWAAGIPGTLGGACAMNAGAYGGEMKQVIKRVRYLEEGAIREETVKDTDLGYRKSAFSAPERMVLAAVLQLEEDDGQAQARLKEYTARRREKQPLRDYSAGSTFKRPEGHYAGALIEGAGLKGLSVGGAQVSKLHAGFLINTGSATAEDMLHLIALVQRRVYEKYGVLLERELKVW